MKTTITIIAVLTMIIAATPLQAQDWSNSSSIVHKTVGSDSESSPLASTVVPTTVDTTDGDRGYDRYETPGISPLLGILMSLFALFGLFMGIHQPNEEEIYS